MAKGVGRERKKKRMLEAVETKKERKGKKDGRKRL
jgi:hypothetical protein